MGKHRHVAALVEPGNDIWPRIEEFHDVLRDEYPGVVVGVDRITVDVSRPWGWRRLFYRIAYPSPPALLLRGHFTEPDRIDG